MGALCMAGASPTDDHIRGATDYIISRQNPDGGWSNSYDEWFAERSPRRPYRCLNYAGWWALIALLHSVDHDPKARLACREAVNSLLDKQLPDGAWRFEEYEDTPHVWLTAQVVTALDQWRRRQNGHDSRSHLRAVGDAALYGIAVFRRNIYNIVLGVLVVAQFVAGRRMAGPARRRSRDRPGEHGEQPAEHRRLGHGGRPHGRRDREDPRQAVRSAGVSRPAPGG